MRLRPILFVALVVLAACSGSGDAEPSADDGGGELSASVALQDGHALIGSLEIHNTTGDPVAVTVAGAEREFDIPVDASAAQQQAPVLGLRAASGYQVTVTAGDEVVELDLSTDPLPDDLPVFEVATASPDRVSPGVTLFNVLDVTGQLDADRPDAAPEAGVLIGVDEEGEVVWYLRSDHPMGDVRQLDDGTLLVEYNDTAVRRVSMTGEVLQEWAGRLITGPLAVDEFGRRVVGEDPIEVDVDSMHHEVGRLNDGNLLTLSTELRTTPGFDEPVCGDDPDFDGDYDLISDVVVEFTPEGEVVAEYPLADVFDPVAEERDRNICGLPFDQIFPNWLYRAQGFSEALDWTHANAVVPDPTGDAFTVSVRHLDAVLNIDRETGEVLWRFGPDGDFTIDDPADFAYHQHAPEWQDDGTLLLYDNGNQRPGTATDQQPDLPPPYSRAVQFALDPEAGTAEVVWEHVTELGGRPLFAPFVGDADRLENGNVLITNGALGADHPTGVTAQVIEVVPDEDGEGGDTVLDIRFAIPDRELFIYRAERLPSLYGPP